MNSDCLPSADDVREALVRVLDPELRLSIVELGLVYDVRVREDASAKVLMTFTSPGCPVGPLLVSTVEDVVKEVPGVSGVEVEVTFVPAWDPRTMASDEILMQLGIW